MAKPIAKRRRRYHPRQHIDERTQHARGFLDELRSAEERVRSENPDLSDPVAVYQLVDKARLECHKHTLDAVDPWLKIDTHDELYLKRMLCTNIEYYYLSIVERNLYSAIREHIADIEEMAREISRILNNNRIIRGRLQTISQLDGHWSLRSSDGYLIPEKSSKRDPVLTISDPLVMTLHAIDRLAEWARMGRPSPKHRGRIADEALNHFVVLLAQLWRCYLRRPFNPRSTNCGSLHEFVCIIMRHVDPHVTDARIKSALREAGSRLK